MPRNRKAKIGVVYLLKNTFDFELPVYKYGCSADLDKRVKQLNRTYSKRFHFVVISTIKTEDIFQLEKNIKWVFWENPITALSEIFTLPDGWSEEDLVNKFISAAAKEIDQ